jgi:hypothetical protein
MHTVKVILIILSGIFYIGHLNAQSPLPVKVDSMLVELSRAKEYTNKVWLLCDIIFDYDEYKLPSNLKYAKMAIALAKQLKSQKAIAKSWLGIKKFAYDIWGDTVNVVSRMKSHGEAEKVDISDSTFELVHSKFNCTHRGNFMTKSKGEIDKYYVERKI